MSNNKPTVLCVDDEPQVLRGLALHLRRDYTLLTAQSGDEGLELLATNDSVAAIISDMRMPGMDGASFLARARKASPGSIRILLTGYADIEAAIRAVNQGHLFRFLTKPCPPQELKIVVKAAVAQHRLLNAERELLEKTLQGSVAVLAETLSLAVPEVYGDVSGVHTLAQALGRIAGLEPAWPLNVASMLAYLGLVSLPREVAVRAVNGETLTAAEAKMLAEAPGHAARLLRHIPRLEHVRAIIQLSFDDRHGENLPEGDARDLVETSAGLLRVAMDFHRLSSDDTVAEDLLLRMRENTQRYRRDALDCLAGYLGEIRDQEEVEIELGQLRVGMTLAEGLRTRSGVLVAARAHAVTEQFLERVHNYPNGTLMDRIKVHPERTTLPA